MMKLSKNILYIISVYLYRMLHLSFFIVFLVLTTVPSALGQTDLEQALNDALNTEAPPVFRNGKYVQYNRSNMNVCSRNLFIIMV